MMQRTAVREVDLGAFPAEGLTGLDGYGQAYIIVRLNGHLLCRLDMPVKDGRIEALRLWDMALGAAGPGLWNVWLQQWLGWDDLGPLEASQRPASVAVCTRDRPEDLQRCLDALLAMPDHGQELLVVDSASRGDDTRRVAEIHGERVRYLREERPGLNRARNRALREAHHEWVAFIDDDAVPDASWLTRLLRPCADPRVWCVTGNTLSWELETRAQQIQERYSSFSRGFVRRSFGPLAMPAASGWVGAGVNMALRRRVLEVLGPFDPALDAGTLTCSGGDNEMFGRILAAGYHIVYEPTALARHRHRRDDASLQKAFFGYGVGVYAAWTRALVCQHDWQVLRGAWLWWRHEQLPGLFRRARRGLPRRLQVLQLLGCLAGPWAYLRSRLREGKA